MHNEGEKRARDFLAAKGYEVLAVNFRAGRIGEIDIVCRDGDEIVFVEVKSRGGSRCGNPEEGVDCKKIRKIIKVAEIYLQKNHLEDCDFRIDVVAITGEKVEHLKDVMV